MPTTSTLFENPAIQNGEGTTEDDTDNRKHVRRVGWIPEEWDAVSLGKLLSLSNGKSRPDDMRDERTGEHTTPVFGGNGVMGYAREQLVEGPRIIIGRVGALCGVVHLAEGKYWVSDNAMYTQNLEALEIPPRFLWYLLDFSDLGRYRQESSQPLITQRIVKQKKVPLPPPQEQARIAKILGTWNCAIEQVNALIEQKRERLHGLRQRLLTGEVRFPEFDEPWTETTLGDYFRYFSNRNSDEQDLPVLSCSKVHGIIRQSEKFDRRVASKDTSNYKIVERGDLVYDPMLLWDASIGFLDCVEQGVVSPAYYTFKFDEERGSRDFFRHLLATHWVKYQYKAISQGTNTRRRKAPRDAFLGIEVEVPSLPEQKKIAEVMRAAETEIQHLEEKRNGLKRQKKGLMQRFLTGAVRTV